MQYKIPQDVQREDKIIGPFTLQQFLYLISGAMMGYIVFSIVSKIAHSFGVGFLFGIIFFAAIGAFAVIEIQGKSLPDFVVAFILFSLRPRKRVWQKDIFIPDIAYIPTKKKEGAPPKDPSQIKSELEKLSHVLDTRGWGKLAEEEEEIETMYKKVLEEEEAPPPPEKEEIPMDVGITRRVKKEAFKKGGEVQIKPEIARGIPAQEAVKKKEAEITKKEVAEKEAQLEAKKEALEKRAEEEVKRQKIIQEEFRKSQKIIQKEIKEEIKKKNIQRKENIKKLRDEVSKIEEAVKNPPKPKVRKKLEFNLIPRIHLPWPTKKVQKETRKPYVEEYKIDLENRVTTPRIETPVTNIKIDENKLEDILEDTERIKTLKKEFEEVETALKKQQTKKRPHIIKEPGSYFELKRLKKKKGNGLVT